MPITTILDDKPVSEFKPVIESSTYRSYQEFKKVGVPDDEIPRAIMSQYTREVKFLSALTKDEKPIRTIRRMVRFKDQNKEWLRFTEDWTGKNFLGGDINPVTDRIEGVFMPPNVQPLKDEKGQRIGIKVNGYKTQYEIPFSKTNVDKWIKETGTDKDSITYTVRTDKRRDNCVTYDQFVNATWIQANDMMMQDGGFEMAYVEGLRSKKPSSDAGQ